MKAMEEPYTSAQLREMQERDGRVKGVISLPWDEIGDIDSLNDLASAALTGDEGALEDICYRLVGADLEAQTILLEVSGTVENWLPDIDGAGDEDED